MRLWPILIPGIALTAAAGMLTWAHVAPTYEARASMLLLSPATAPDPEGGSVGLNPFARSGTAERVAATAVLIVTHSDRWETQLEAAGARGEVEYELSAEASIIGVRAQASTPGEALGTLDVAVSQVEQELRERQLGAGAPQDTLIQADVLSLSEEPAVLVGSKVRAVGAVTVLGLAATASLIYLVEALRPGWAPSPARLRSRRRRSRAAVSTPAEIGNP